MNAAFIPDPFARSVQPSNKIQAKVHVTKLPRGIRLSRRNCPFGLSCKYVYLGQNPRSHPSVNLPVRNVLSIRGSSAI